MEEDEKKIGKLEQPEAQHNFRILKNRSVWFLGILGLVINLAGYGLLWWQIKPVETSVILHYNAFLGIDVIDFDLKSRYYQLFAASLGGTFIWLLNVALGVMILRQTRRFQVLGKKQESEERKLGGLLLLSSVVVVQLGLLVYVLAIIRVNT